jgi:hypothetical protein
VLVSFVSRWFEHRIAEAEVEPTSGIHSQTGDGPLREFRDD